MRVIFITKVKPKLKKQMKKIVLESIEIRNWRSINFKVDFKQKTTIHGKNELGKSSIYHAWCWLMCGKTDADNVKNFNLYDENVPLSPDTPEASVKAVIKINDFKYTIERKAKPKYTRTRGTNEYVKAASDNYTYMIDDIEVTVATWNEFLDNNICDNNYIEYILAGDFFSKKTIEDKIAARKILQGLIGDIKQEDYKEDYSVLYPLMTKGYSLEQIEEQAQNRKKQLENTISGLPSIISDKEKSLSELNQIDYSEIERRIELQKKEIADIDSVILGESNKIKPLLEQRDNILKKIDELTLDLNKEKMAYEKSWIDKTSDVRGEIQRLQKENEWIKTRNKQAVDKMESYKRSLSYEEYILQSLQKEIQELRNKRDELKNLTYDVNKNICPYCGQSLPSDMVEKNQKDFLDKKDSELKSIVISGKNLAQKITEKETYIEELKNKIAAGVEQESYYDITELNNLLVAMEAEKKPFTETFEYNKINGDINQLRQSMPDIPITDHSHLSMRKQELLDDIEALSKQIGYKSYCIKLQKEIDEHKTLLRDCSAEIADMEKRIFKIKQYREEMAKIISERINNKLTTAKIEMFRMQKDGTLVSDCVLRGKNNVQYSTINNSSKTLINIELQCMMMQHFDVSMPIWVDEAKNFDDEHLPQIDDCQMIYLYASNSPILTVE